MSLPPPGCDPALVAALRTDLRAAGVTVERVAEHLGPVASAALHREQPLPALRVLDGRTDPLSVLLRVFTLGRPTTAALLDAALPTLGSAGALALGIVHRPAPEADDADGIVLAPTCDLRPYGDETHDWWVASDLSEIATGRPLEPDHVLGIGGASTTLASWTIRTPVGRALDLGTGCGVQALHLADQLGQPGASPGASPGSTPLVATDLSRRALAFARFTAALNEVELDLRAGDMLEPVRGERFDLIVSNPPFVITPRMQGVPLYEYRDGGRTGDEVVRALVREVGEHLEPGGVAQFLGNWEVPNGQTWQQVWQRWLEGVGLDAWVIQRQVQDPAEYAELWARDGGTRPGTPEHDAYCAAWLQDFAARDIGSIGFGVVTLHRPTTGREPFRDLQDEPGPVATPMGPTIAGGLRARVWLAEHTDDDLLDTAWSVAPDVTEERHARPGDEDPSVILVRQGGGLGRVVRADTALAAYLSVADGSLTARQALVAIASLLELDAADLLTAMTPTVRGLVSDGLLQ